MLYICAYVHTLIMHTRLGSFLETMEGYTSVAHHYGRERIRQTEDDGSADGPLWCWKGVYMYASTVCYVYHAYIYIFKLVGTSVCMFVTRGQLRM